MYVCTWHVVHERKEWSLKDAGVHLRFYPLTVYVCMFARAKYLKYGVMYVCMYVCMYLHTIPRQVQAAFDSLDLLILP